MDAHLTACTTKFDKSLTSLKHGMHFYGKKLMCVHIS